MVSSATTESPMPTHLASGRSPARSNLTASKLIGGDQVEAEAMSFWARLSAFPENALEAANARGVRSRRRPL